MLKKTVRVFSPFVTSFLIYISKNECGVVVCADTNFEQVLFSRDMHAIITCQLSKRYSNWLIPKIKQEQRTAYKARTSDNLNGALIELSFELI